MAVPVLLVASSGGHLNQLYRLRDGWPKAQRLWVTFPTPDALSLLADERTVHAFHPTNRSVVNLARNAGLAMHIVRRERPAALITTGAGVAVPFAYAAKCHGVPVIYIEGLGRVDDLSLSARLARPAIDRLFVQWPELAERAPGTIYAGALL